MRALALTPVIAMALLLWGCASTPRAPAWTCMQRTMDALPLAGMSDDRKHCFASGAIAIRCGRASAFLAGWGKEFADLCGPGDPSWHDLKADRAGRDCARGSGDQAGLPECCANSGY